MFDLLIKYIKEGRIKLDKSRIKVLATYHDPCNYGRKAESIFGHAYYDEPRWILDQCMENWVDLYPTKENQLCCGGGGGTLTTGYNDERIAYGKKKMDQIRATGAEMVIVPCHSCHGQLNSIKKEYGMENLTVKYLWELVADCLIL
ncbi:MAG: (Fe-S)-binding protein [Proteobacteria bacterium]|nr:(Fe-S)-binding protein [Pseudomonadota bacterium]MBU1712451.1 (Fe-S)-binding protein [Pseudomonadota bacterium]